LKYARPDIGNNTIAYKGRRYWAIELAPDGKFDFVTKELGDYVLWDCLYDRAIATIIIQDDGSFIGTIMSHVPLSFEYGDIELAAKDLPREYDAYLKYVYD